MATLSVAARTKIYRGLMRYWSNNREPTPGITKADLYDPGTDTGAVADTDDWMDSAEGGGAPATSFNNALSEPFKSAASMTMKNLVFGAVWAVRFDGTGDLARRLLQVEVD